MPRTLIVIIALSFALAACAGTGGQADTTGGTAASATTAASTVPEETTSTQPTPMPTGAPGTTEAARPVAPDFTLELGEGGEYTLSEGAKPVYLVFWAEW